jgi:serine/threonine protein kinase
MERCPDKRMLQALLESDTATDTALQGHLDGCADCRHTLEMIAADPATWDSAMGLSQPYWSESALKELMGRLKEAETPLSDDQITALLDSSDKPGVLGVLAEYEVQEVIGRGAMAVVFKAIDTKLNRLVALKVLSPRLASSVAAQKRFLREARAAACVHHENVVQMLAVCEDRGLPYLVMQYLDGESVQNRIDRLGSLGVQEIVRIGYQTATGLAAAHKQGLIHRDIKPANLMLNGVGDLPIVKITDFGLARAVDDTALTSDRAVIGTPEYMSPEQARGAALDQRSDLFSLGSVLYAMCTGKSPFRGESAVAVLRRVSDETPTPVRSLNPEVPEWLASLIERLMAKNPADRFATAKEVADLLQGYLAHLQTAAPAPTLPAAPRRNRLKGRGVVLMAATLLLLAVFAALLVRSLPVSDWRIVAFGLGGLFGVMAMAAFAFVYWWPIVHEKDNKREANEPRMK